MSKNIIIKSLILTLTTLLSHSVKSQINIDSSSFNSSIKELHINNQTIIVLGETHSIKNTETTELFIIKNLVSKGFNKLYIEGGKSEAIILNMFLEMGDTNLLQHTRARVENDDYKVFIQSLRHMKNNITFKGFDFERPSCVAFLFSQWFKGVKINKIDFDSLTTFIYSLDKPNSRNLKAGNHLEVIFNSLKKSLTENELTYKNILLDNFGAFKSIIYNPVNPNMLTRDSNFIKSILNEEKENKLTNSIFIIGSNHLLFKNKFIPTLIDTLPEKYTLYSFVFIYKNCKSTDKTGKFSSKKELLKYLTSKNKEESLIRFTLPEAQLIPSIKKNTSIITELYNQK